MKHRCCALTALALLTPALPAPAWAQMCNAFDPGNRVVGYAPGPMGVPLPICVRDQAATRDTDEQQPAPDPMQARTDAATAQVNALHGIVKRQQELLNDPEYQRLRAGYWELPDQDAGAKRGMGCSATFKSMTGMLAVMAPAQRGQPVMTMFTGMDVPKPAEPRQVEVVFHQSGGETMTMPAMNFTMGADAPGTIAIGVADLPSLLAGIKDAEDLAIDLDGRRIYELAYHDGNAMKTSMQRCEAATKP